jgi:hypothetical protein
MSFMICTSYWEPTHRDEVVVLVGARSKATFLPSRRKRVETFTNIMLWGAIGFGYKSDLVNFPSKNVDNGELRQFRLNTKSYTTKRTAEGQLEEVA